MSWNAEGYRLVCTTLETLGYTELIDKFIENDLDDAYLGKCVSNSTIQGAIDQVVKTARRQHEFICEFTNRLSRTQKDFVKADAPTQEPDSSTTVEYNGFRESFESSLEPITRHDDKLWESKQEFSGSQPRAIQIMDFDEKSCKQLEILFYKQQLASILLKTGNRPVAIVAIAGAKRQGKSLYLNFILRHLQNLRGTKTCHEDEPLVGFTWRGSYERVTRGMWMWSEPFTLRSKHDGSEFDVLLVDTQGVFDQQTGPREWSILMGLSLLTSSCIIFNVMQNINENDLQILASFLSFGKLAMQDEHFSNGERPFQKLVYLIRDFGNADEFPYGSEGGKKFIQKVLGTCDGSRPENNTVREKIRECFQEISCILLPPPERQVLSKDYNGSTSVCKEFASEIQKSITQLVDREDIPTVKINGNNLTGQEILELFEVYVNLFNQSELVHPPSIYYATMEACNVAVANKCTESFVKFIQKRINERGFLSNDDLDRSFDEAYTSSLQQFRSSSHLMGTQAAVNKTENNLLQQLLIEFEKLKSSNTTNRIGAEVTMNEAVKRTIEQYVSAMGSEIGNHTLAEHEVAKSHKEVLKKCMEDFTTEYSLSPLLTQGRSKISQEIENEMNRFQQQMLTTRKNIEEEIDQVVSLYRSQMEAATCLKKLSITYPLAKSDALDSIRNSENIPETEKAMYSLQLESKLTNIHGELIQNFLINMNALQLEAIIERAIKSAKKEYKKFMTACTNENNDFFTESELEEAHKINYPKASLYLQELLHREIVCEQISEENLKSIVNDLSDSIQRCYAKVKEINTRRAKEAQENVNVEIQKCVQLYLVMMESDLKGKLLSNQEILEFHNTTAKRCVEEFLQINCNSTVLKNEQENLKHKIHSELENLLEGMNTQIGKHNEDASAQASTAESNYVEEMMKVTDGETLEHFHSLYKKKAKKSLQPFKHHLNEEFIQQLSSNMEERIEKIYEDLIRKKDEEKKQLVNSIAEMQQKGLTLYTENMTLFLKEGDEYYPDQLLMDRHNHEKTEAVNLVKGFCSKLPSERTKVLGEEYQENEVLLQLFKAIDNAFIQFQQQNNERKTMLEHQLQAEVKNKVDLYKTTMDSRMKDGFLSEDQLNKEHSAVQQQCVQLFKNDNSTITDPLFTLGFERLLFETNCVYSNYQRIMIESEIKNAKESALSIYKVYADTLMSQLDGSLSGAQLEEQHNGKKREALEFLENSYKSIACNSEDILNQKKSDQNELNTTIETLNAQLVKTNNRKRNQANKFLKQQVETYIEKYETEMTTEMDKEVLPQSDIREAHQKIRSNCLNEFSEKNKSSIFIVQGREILVKKIDEKGDGFQRQMKGRIESLNERGRQLVADGISTYRSKISKCTLDNIEAFNASHNIIQDFVIESIFKAGDIPEEFKAEFIRDLKLEIQTEYDQCMTKREESKEEIEKGSKVAREATLEQYYDNIKKVCSTNEYIEDSELESQHKVEQEKAEECLKNFFLNLPIKSESVKEQERNGLKKLRDSIKQTFAQFQTTNKSNELKSKEIMNNSVTHFSQEYTRKMMSSINQEIVLGTKFETIHNSTFDAIMSDFSQANSTSILLTKGKNDLIQKIGEEKSRLEIEMVKSNMTMSKTGSSLVAHGLDGYSREMQSVIGTETFESDHLKNREFQLESIKNSGVLTGIYLDKFYSQLESEINTEFVRLLGLHYQDKNNVIEKASKAREKEKRKYEEEMETLFTEDGKPIYESTLEEKHNLAKPKAIDALVKMYKGFKSQLKNYEGMKAAALSELEEHIDKHHLKLKDRNKLLWTAFEAKASSNLSDVKAEYAKRLREIQDAAMNVEELETRDLALRLEVERSMSDKVDGSTARKEFIQKLTQELKDYMAQHYDQTLVDFRLRLVRDETAVTGAFQKASQYYNEEMDKGFQAQTFFKPQELLQLSDGIVERAIVKCKQVVDALSENQERQLREAMKQTYTKYHDKNLKQYPCKDAAIGIDLGTTYSCVAVYMNGDVKIIPNREFNQSPTTASYVSFRDDHTIVVGDAAKAQASRYPVDTIFDAKRLIGRSINDEIVQNDIKLWPFLVVDDGGHAKIKVQGNVFHPEEISAKLLAKMKANAEDFLNQPVTQAVITVPAYFSDAQRQATKDAAEIAGLTGARILNEPTAAAIAYNLHCKDEIRERNVLIFDLGGGTFDVAVLQIKGNDIQVKATGGDTHLGGEDFDNRMVEEMIRRVKEKHGIDLARGRNSDDPLEKKNSCELLRRLRDSCEEAKRHLGSSTSFEIYVDRLDGDFGLKETITREEFENLNKDLFEKCIAKVQATFEQAKIDKEKLDDIVLVGGSTRILKVQQLLKDFFDGKKILCTSINPDEAVACGAAIHAAVLNGEQAANIGDGFKLTDVTPLPIGIENNDHTMSVIIEKNTSVPCDRVRRYCTVLDNQTSVRFKVYEGEDVVAAKNKFLGEFCVNGIPRNKVSVEKVDCTMTIDSEGILSVKAQSCSSGSAGTITIKTHKGRMTKEQIRWAKKQDPFKW